jgi:hypothetical protein
MRKRKKKMSKTTKSLLKVLLGTTLVSALFDPLSERANSFVGQALRQVREHSTGFTKTVIEMVVIACLGFVGVVFLLMGLALFLESRLTIPGTGLGYVGTGILLFSLLVLLVLKYHNQK